MITHFKDPINATELPVFTEHLDLYWADLNNTEQSEFARFQDTGFVRRIAIPAETQYYFDTIDDLHRTATEHFGIIDAAGPKPLRVVGFIWGMIYDPTVEAESNLLPTGYHMAAHVDFVHGQRVDYSSDEAKVINDHLDTSYKQKVTQPRLSDLFANQCLTRVGLATLVDIDLRFLNY